MSGTTGTTDPLADAGLEPAPTDEPDNTPPAPETPPPVEDEIVIPEGAENPDAVKNAIKAERTAAKNANARARKLEEELRAQEDASKPLEQKIADANAATIAAEHKALQYEVAAESGLSLTLASRLVGTSRDELIADAESLKAMIGTKPRVPAVPPEGGHRTPPPAKGNPTKEHDKFLSGILGLNRDRDALAMLGLEQAPEDEE